MLQSPQACSPGVYVRCERIKAENPDAGFGRKEGRKEGNRQRSTREQAGQVEGVRNDERENEQPCLKQAAKDEAPADVVNDGLKAHGKSIGLLTGTIIVCAGRRDSTDSNMRSSTQQGYFVIVTDPTESTTFGKGMYSIELHYIKLTAGIEFTDAVAEDWGGKPFVNI
ncbi:hypothetical protein H0H92_004000 [Tricholoma furcatifolium]|nr:hypothetical protein H0H92_004000 [Tricholoma furcatifolium]